MAMSSSIPVYFPGTGRAQPPGIPIPRDGWPEKVITAADARRFAEAMFPQKKVVDLLKGTAFDVPRYSDCHLLFVRNGLGNQEAEAMPSEIDAARPGYIFVFVCAPSEFV